MIATLLLTGCVQRGPEGRPDTLYETAPDTPYAVIGEVTAEVCLYGGADPGGGYRKVGARTQDRAAQKLWENAERLGADAVIDVATEGGCTPRWTFDPLCNCVATATGTAVKLQIAAKE